jgi:uncharacterized protein
MQNRTSDNKQTTKLLFERISARDIDGTLALLTDDATWRLPGKPERLPSAGIYDVARLRRLFERMFERLESGLAISVLDCVAEGDRVAVEFESSGDLRNGRQYRQQYHSLLQFRDGKVSAVREYLDTLHVQDVWHRE